MTFEEWFDVWDQTKDPEIRRLCEVAFRVGRSADQVVAQAYVADRDKLVSHLQSLLAEKDATIERLQAELAAAKQSLRWAFSHACTDEEMTTGEQEDFEDNKDVARKILFPIDAASEAGKDGQS